MKKAGWMVGIMLVVALLQTGAGMAAAAQGASAAAIDQRAMATLMKMADFLSHAKSFGVTVETGYDVVQESGQKIEFGAVRKIVLDRPNRARVDIAQRDGGKAEFVFDGKEIYVFNSQDNVYGVVKKPGTIDQAMDYFTQDLQMRLPLAELFSTDLPEMLREHVRVLDAVGTSVIDGVSCDHLAARGETVDFQVWIEQGDKPLPRRFILSYKHAAGEPQFWARFQDWDLSPKISGALFAIKPPKGAERISFVALMQETSKAGDQKGE